MEECGRAAGLGLLGGGAGAASNPPSAEEARGSGIQPAPAGRAQVIDPADTRRVVGLSLAAALNAPLGDSSYGVFRM